MTDKLKLTDANIKNFIKTGGRKNAKSDFFKILNKSTSNIDKKR